MRFRWSGKGPPHAAVNPLSTNRCVPFTKLASSLARKSAALATSIGLPMRPRVVAMAALDTSTPRACRAATSRRPCGVSMKPGQTALQRMPLSRNSTATAWANISTVPLVVSWSTSIGVLATAEIDEVQTIDPPPAAIAMAR